MARRVPRAAPPPRPAWLAAAGAGRGLRIEPMRPVELVEQPCRLADQGREHHIFGFEGAIL